MVRFAIVPARILEQLVLLAIVRGVAGSLAMDHHLRDGPAVVRPGEAGREGGRAVGTSKHGETRFVLHRPDRGT